MAFTRTAGAAGNASASGSLGANSSRTFILDYSAVQFGVLEISVTSGAAVAATAGVNFTIFQGAGSTVAYETVASISGQVPVTAVSTTTARTVTIPQGVWQVTVTNVDVTNAVTLLATSDTYN